MRYITNTDSSILPYNDSDMKYDIDLRMYVLTPTGFQSYTGIDLLSEFDSPEQAESFLREISEDVYEFIYSTTLYHVVNHKRWYIAKTSDIREGFKQALISQARASYRSGLNLIKDQHGINIEKGKTIQINDLYNRMIAPRTKDQLSRLGLVYSGFIHFENYSEDGTF